MRKLLALAAFAVPLSFFAIPTPAAAQYVYGVSAILLDTELDHAYGYSATLLDYEACYYYDAGVVGTLREEPFTDLASYGVRGVCSAEVYTDGPTQENRVYTEYSDHYLFAIYYVYYYGGWYDPFGYGFLGGGDYGGGFSFSGCYYCGGYFAQTQQDLGSTNASLLNPEDVCNKTPTLSGESEVTRAQSAEFKLDMDNLCPGAQISGWKFTDSSGNAVSRSSGVSNSTWGGLLVTSGTIQATVLQKAGSSPYVLTKTVHIRNREGFDFGHVEPEEVSSGFDCREEGGLLLIPNPPVRGADGRATFGKMCLIQRSTRTNGRVSDQGPNQGFHYIAAIRDEDNSLEPRFTSFYFAINEDLKNPASTFYRAQCGNYDPATNTGFISGAQLLSNTREHEAGLLLGHYAQYMEANSTYNVGRELEKLVAPPTVSAADFAQTGKNLVTQQRNLIRTATLSEAACNSDVGYDPNCTDFGPVNFSPYVPCTPPPPPSSPTTVSSASASPTQVNLTWADTSTSELGFKIERSFTGGAFAEIGAVGPNVTSFSDTTVTAGSTYAYRVVAWNGGGSSAPSATVTVTTPNASSNQPPNAPCCLWNDEGYAASGSALLSWIDQSDNEQGYWLERRDGWGGWWYQVTWLGPDSAGWRDDGLQGGTTYSYRVVAYNEYGTATSDEVSVTIPWWVY